MNAKRERWILLGILAVALFLRLAHLFEIEVNDPFFTLPAVDGQEYHARAQEIVAGNWLGEGVVILGPFYPHFMALVYAVAGPSLYALKLVQALLGVLSCWLVFVLARLYFDSATALLAAAFAALYKMFIFYGGTVMIVNVMIPLVLLSAIAVTRALRDPTTWRWALAGLAVAGAALARQNLLIFAVLVLAWLFYALHGRQSWGRRAALAASFVAGMAVLILPFTARNWIQADDFILLNSTGGISVYMGNSPGADGAWVPPSLGVHMRVDTPRAMQEAFEKVAERETGRQLKPSEVSSYWRGRTVDWVLQNPGQWLSLEMRKLLLFFNAREIWNNRSIDVSREFSWVLRLPLVSFAVMAPLALLGMGLARGRLRELFLLYAMAAVFLATCLIFFVLSRYRIGVVPILLVFAAHAVVVLVAKLRERDWKTPALAAGWLVVFALVVFKDMGDENLYMAYFNMGNKYRDLGRYEEAIAAYDLSLEIGPGFIATHNNQALAYEAAGRAEEAIARWRYVYDWAKRKGNAPRLARARDHLRELLNAPPGWTPDDPLP